MFAIMLNHQLYYLLLTRKAYLLTEEDTFSILWRFPHLRSVSITEASAPPSVSVPVSVLGSPMMFSCVFLLLYVSLKLLLLWIWETDDCDCSTWRLSAALLGKLVGGYQTACAMCTLYVHGTVCTIVYSSLRPINITMQWEYHFNKSFALHLAFKLHNTHEQQIR